MESFSVSGSLLVPASLASRIRLLLVMTRREVELRYRDAMLGRIWIIVSPFLLLLIYTFVFGFVLKSRWGGSQSTLSFALTLFSGLLLNGILAESLSRAPTIIQANANYVKKLVFPWRYSPSHRCWPLSSTPCSATWCSVSFFSSAASSQAGNWFCYRLPCSPSCSA